jgi:hypothetical protein
MLDPCRNDTLMSGGSDGTIASWADSSDPGIMTASFAVGAVHEWNGNFMVKFDFPSPCN